MAARKRTKLAEQARHHLHHRGARRAPRTEPKIECDGQLDIFTALAEIDAESDPVAGRQS